MSTLGIEVALTLFGSAAELAGVVLGLVVFYERGRRLRAYEATLLEVRTTLNPVHEFNDAHPITSTPAPPLEERLTALERRLEDQRQTLMQRVQMLHDDAVNMANHRVGDLEINIRQNLTRVETLLKAVAGVGWAELTAPGLLVLGLTMQVLSNFLQLGGQPS